MDGTENESTAIAGLVRAAASQQKGAFDALILACKPFVEGSARKYVWSNTDPDDIVQEVWIQLLEHVGRIREPQALFGWLQVVTRRLAAHEGHRDKRMVPTAFDDNVASASCTEEQAIANQEQRQVTCAVRNAVERLSEADRELLSLLNADSGPQHYREISRRVRRPVGSLGPTRRRILNRLGHDPAVRPLRQLTPAS